VLYDFSPNLDLAEQKRSTDTETVAVFLFAANHVSERIDSVGSNIPGGWLVGMPDILPHVNAMKAIIASPKPPWVDYLPSPVGDHLSDTNTVVFEVSRKLFLISVYRHRRARYRTGSGSGSVTGGAFSGDLLGGGDVTGSGVGSTGSSSGMTV
jgi:hypothetical protein